MSYPFLKCAPLPIGDKLQGSPMKIFKIRNFKSFSLKAYVEAKISNQWTLTERLNVHYDSGEHEFLIMIKLT